jgi:hypothetical protein
MVHMMIEVKERSRAELDELFRNAPAGEIPVGPTAGTALFAPGKSIGKLLATLTRLLFWQGKEFEPETRRLKNLITPFGVRAIAADVYEADSWLDGGRCIVLDYSKTSWVARWVRDEIREMEPNHYLGIVYVRTRRLPLMFALRSQHRPL